MSTSRGEDDDRLKRIEELEEDLENEKGALKQAIVTLDPSAEQNARQRIGEIATDINQLIDEAIDVHVPSLDPFRLETGQIGHAGGWHFEILQVIEKSTGTALVTPVTPGGRRGKSFFVHNIDLSNVVDDDFVNVSPNLIFEVAGTRTYTTVLGGSNTAYELLCFLDLGTIRGALSSRKKTADEEPSLTEDERKQLESRKRWEAAEAWETLQPRLADGMTQTLTGELREFAARYDGTPEATRASEELDAASKLELAKQLIENGKRGIGERWLREIGEKWPETVGAAEARRLLGE